MQFKTSLVLLLVTFSVFSHSAYADDLSFKGCNCVPPKNKDIYKNSEYIFTGKVKDLVINNKSIDQSYFVDFKVNQALKGDINDQYRIEAGGRCGYRFDYNREYIVFPHNRPENEGEVEDYVFYCRALPIEQAGSLINAIKDADKEQKIKENLEKNKVSDNSAENQTTPKTVKSN